MVRHPDAHGAGLGPHLAARAGPGHRLAQPVGQGSTVTISRIRPPVRSGLLGLLAVMVVTFVASPSSGAAPVPGSAGTDTSLPATDSQVTVAGRGPFADLRITVNQTKSLANQAISVTWTGG